MKNTISELMNTLEGINHRIDEAEDGISDLEDKVEKKHPIRAAKRKKAFLKMRALFFLFYLFICRERGREGEGEGEKHHCVVASHVPPTGDLARN